MIDCSPQTVASNWFSWRRKSRIGWWRTCFKERERDWWCASVLCKFDTSRENEEEKNTVKTNLERALLARLSLSPKKAFTFCRRRSSRRREKKKTHTQKEPTFMYLFARCVFPFKTFWGEKSFITVEFRLKWSHFFRLKWSHFALFWAPQKIEDFCNCAPLSKKDKRSHTNLCAEDRREKTVLLKEFTT